MRFSWVFAAALVATSVAIASALPSQPNRSPAPNGSSHAAASRPTEIQPSPALVVAGFAAERLAIRTQLIGDLRNLVHGADPMRELRLAPAAPPYSNPQRGHFEVRTASVTGRIERSIFEAAQAAGLPEHLTTRMAEIFGWDVDMALGVREGDTFAVIYEQRYWLGRKLEAGPILAAEFVNQGRIYRAIAFRSENGKIDYYSPDGRSLRRPFLRTPVNFSRVSSHFSKSRYHPVLKLRRPHTGVDYVAPAGEPVRATGDGRIALLGRNGGYGKTVVIDHGDGYSTLYAHLSRYRPRLSAGATVRQGETIGYVGRTGLTNGTHLHYEFRVNGRHQDPLTYEFPAGDLLPMHERGEFRRVAAEWTAQLQLLGDRQLAATAIQ